MRHCAANWKVVDLSPDEVTGIFVLTYPSGRTQPIMDMITRSNSLGLKEAGV